MAEAAFDYDELLGTPGSVWRGRLIWLAMLGIVVAAVATGVWWEFMRGGASAATTVQTATVSLGNVTKSVSTSGTVAAQSTSNLSFETSGRVTKVDVTLGQQVKKGDVLAEIDSTDTQSALASAKLSLSTAQSKLSTLLEGSTASALASADQSLQQAQANYNKAVRALDDLQKPADAVALESAEQAVITAQAQLQQTKDVRAKIDTDGDAAVKAGRANVDKAENALTAAEQSQTNAAASVSSTQAALYSAETAYCPDAAVSFCSSHAAPVSQGDQMTLVGVTNSGTPDQAKAAAAALSANTSYTKAVSDKQGADNAVTSASTALSDAEDALAKAKDGPTAGQVAVADAAIGSAQAQVDAAQDKLTKLQAGATADDLAAAEADIDTAGASLTSAQAKRDETYAGPVSADIQQQRQSVSQAQNAVDKAQKDLDNTKLTAPFDGTVAALNVQVGDLAGTGGTTASSAAMVLNTPDTVILNLTVSETDYGSVKVGQTGTAVFAAIAGRTFPIIIDSIGSNPTTTQGVVNYVAKAHFVAGAPAGFGANPPVSPPVAGAANGGQGIASGTPGAQVQGGAFSGTPGAGGQGGGRRATAAAAGTPTAPQAGVTPQADTTPVSPPAAGGRSPRGGFGGANGAAASTQKPVPGMNATIAIITAQSQNVLRVPNAAVQRDGQNRVLEVKQSDGSTQRVTVQVGLSDATNTEITSGVNEGATVVLPGVTAVASASAVAGGFAGGGGFPGGGGFGGPGGGGGRGGD